MPKPFSYNDFAYPTESTPLNLDYAARIIEDSITEYGSRLVTYEVTFPRFLLAEFNTHRVLSRNSASSRAIPPEKQIERLLASPFIPEFGTRVKGMGSGEFHPDQQACVDAWLDARDSAVESANKLVALGVDKSRINRLLEPFMWHTVIVTATKWSNFFGLRTDEGAQPEFRFIAKMMQDEYETHRPNEVELGGWHLPMVTKQERVNGVDYCPGDEPKSLTLPMVSAGRTARVSFDTHGRYEPFVPSLKRATGLVEKAHWSPTEHQAMAYARCTKQMNGNFDGDWWQFRKMFAYESDWNKLLGSVTI